MSALVDAHVQNFKNSSFKPNLMSERQKLYKMTSLSKNFRLSYRHVTNSDILFS